MPPSERFPALPGNRSDRGDYVYIIVAKIYVQAVDNNIIAGAASSTAGSFSCVIARTPSILLLTAANPA